jgi:hypothetical protein
VGNVREPGYFSNEKNYEGGLDGYRKIFSMAGESQLTLDSSTSYARVTQYPYAAENLFKNSPDTKLIYLMRSPVERAFSHYVHRYTKELYPNKPITIKFSEFISIEPVCIDDGNYRLQIEKYLEYFDLNSMLFIFTDDLRNDREKVLRDICDFLGIEYSPKYFIQDENTNVTNNYLESMTRVQITKSIKRIPGIEFLLPIIPKSIREMIYKSIRGTGYGGLVRNQFTPVPLTNKEKEELMEYYQPMIKWREELVTKDFSNWYKSQ